MDKDTARLVTAWQDAVANHAKAQQEQNTTSVAQANAEIHLGKRLLPDALEEVAIWVNGMLIFVKRYSSGRYDIKIVTRWTGTAEGEIVKRDTT